MDLGKASMFDQRLGFRRMSLGSGFKFIKVGLDFVSNFLHLSLAFKTIKKCTKNLNVREVGAPPSVPPS